MAWCKGGKAAVREETGRLKLVAGPEPVGLRRNLKTIASPPPPTTPLPGGEGEGMMSGGLGGPAVVV